MRHPVYSRTQNLWLVWVLLPTPVAGTAASLLAEGGTRAVVGATLLALGSALLLMLTSTFTMEVDEGAVEFEFSEWNALQLFHGRIAGTEVVDGKLEALEPQARHDVQ